MIGIDKLKSEIPDNPHQTREVLSILIWISIIIATSGLDLNILSQINDQTQIVQFCFIDGLLAVIYEVRCQQNCERKDAHIVILLFVGGSESFSVEHEDFDGITVGS